MKYEKNYSTQTSLRDFIKNHERLKKLSDIEIAKIYLGYMEQPDIKTTCIHFEILKDGTIICEKKNGLGDRDRYNLSPGDELNIYHSFTIRN